MAVTALVPIISVSLWTLGFRRTVDWIKVTARRKNDVSSDVDVVKEGVAALSRVKRYTPWSGRCLARALGLWWILRRRGVAASLHLGVRITDGKLDAHAWVVHQERVLADSDSVWTEYPGRFASGEGLTFIDDRTR